MSFHELPGFSPSIVNLLFVNTIGYNPLIFSKRGHVLMEIKPTSYHKEF